MKKALVLTSNKRRHMYLTHQVAKNFDLVGIISEPKKDYYSNQADESELVAKHLQKLTETEADYFETVEFAPADLKLIDRKSLNDDSVVEWASAKEPEVIFLFGTGILRDGWLNTFDGKIVNLHLGYSPFYRGSATLFWPFYNRDVSKLGTTIHIAAKKVDAGGILDNVLLDKNDDCGNYYHMTNKLIKKSLDEFPIVVDKYLSAEISPKDQDLSLGSIYKRKDFTEDKLKFVLENYT